MRMVHMYQFISFSHIYGYISISTSASASTVLKCNYGNIRLVARLSREHPNKRATPQPTLLVLGLVGEVVLGRMLVGAAMAHNVWMGG